MWRRKVMSFAGKWMKLEICVEWNKLDPERQKKKQFNFNIYFILPTNSISLLWIYYVRNIEEHTCNFPQCWNLLRINSPDTVSISALCQILSFPLIICQKWTDSFISIIITNTKSHITHYTVNISYCLCEYVGYTIKGLRGWGSFWRCI